MIISEKDYLAHHGVDGQKWGVRHGPPYPLSGSDKKQAKRFYKKRLSSGKKESGEGSSGSKTIKTNSDGSKTIPAGFKFNRVGKSAIDFNKAGGLYVSHGKEDVARYVKNLGPTLIGKLLGQYGDTVQQITVKKPLKMPSDEQVARETANFLLRRKDLLNRFNETIYSSTVTGDFEKVIGERELKAALKNPSGKDGMRLAYGISAMLGNSEYAKDSKEYYDYFKSMGFDAIPDIYDRLSGTSKTAAIVINPDKVEATLFTPITKDMMKAAKAYVKTLEKLKVSDLIKD